MSHLFVASSDNSCGTSSTTSVATQWSKLKNLISLRGLKGLNLKEAYGLLDNDITSTSSTERQASTNNQGVLGNKYLQKYFLENFILFCNDQNKWRCMYSHTVDSSVTKADDTKKVWKKSNSKSLQTDKIYDKTKFTRILSYQQFTQLVNGNAVNVNTVRKSDDIEYFDISEYENVIVYASMYDMHRAFGLELVEDNNQHERENLLVLELLGRSFV